MINGISVIMISYLSDYPNSRKFPEEKFIRSVNSFISQSHTLKELIIVSDGCEKTNKIYEDKFKDIENIKLIKVEKQKSNWPGRLRELGRVLCNYEWICYLDSDDIFHKEHLTIINNEINNLSDEEVLINERKILPVLKDGSDLYYTLIGIKKEDIKNLKSDWSSFKVKYSYATWQIVHKKNLEVKWSDSELRGEDTDFLKNVCEKYKIKRFSGGYMICHGIYNDTIIWDV